METTAKERVEKELEELNEKMTKLTNFLYGNKILATEISREMYFQMESQLFAMQNYARCLQQRLRIWDMTDEELNRCNSVKI